MQRISIFGDSIAYGMSDNLSGGWVEKLRNFLFKKRKEVEIYNFSVSGDDTEELLKHFESECKLSKPHKIIFAIGINDSYYNSKNNKQNISIVEFKNNLKTLSDIAKNFTNDIVFLGLTPVDESKTKPIPWNKEVSYDNKKIKEYDSIITSFSKEKKFTFIKLFNILKSDDLFDGLHPNTAGHEKIFNVVKKIYEK